VVKGASPDPSEPTVTDRREVKEGSPNRKGWGDWGERVVENQHPINNSSTPIT